MEISVQGGECWVRGPKSKKRDGGTVLHKHGRVRTKERKAERRQNIGTGEPCHVARSCDLGTVVPRVALLGAMVAARVCHDVQFVLAARLRL